MVLLTVAQASEASNLQIAPILSFIDTQKTFICIREKDHLPAIDPKIDSLYRYADYLEKRNIDKNEQNPTVFRVIERPYRIGAAQGDYRANQALRKILLTKKVHSENPSEEIKELTERLIQKNIASGYYDMATYVENGMEIKPEINLALQYYRNQGWLNFRDIWMVYGTEPALSYYAKSATLGSPEGQVYASNQLIKLDPQHPGFEIAKAMMHCAAEQENPHAALTYGMQMEQENKPKEALLYYQKAIKSGEDLAALHLATTAFHNTLAPNDPDYMGVAADPERANRYAAISNTLDSYQPYQPTVPDLDNIVPLPPARLPPWDGKIQWEREREANIAPPKPSEALLTKLAQAKQLDPKTGLPDPASIKATPATKQTHQSIDYVDDEYYSALVAAL